MKRLGAFLVALALVGAALVVNRALHDDGSGTAGPGDPAGDDGDSRPVRVVCAREFAEACDALSEADALRGKATFRIESPGRTVTALATGDVPDFDLWLVSQPWPGIAASRAVTSGNRLRLGSAGSPLAEARLELVARSARADALVASCGGLLDGKCLLGLVGRPFSALGVAGDNAAVRLGVEASTETGGLLAVAATTGGWFDRPDFDTTDVAVNDEFRAAFAAAGANSIEDVDPIRTLLTIPKFAVALDVAASERLGQAASGRQYAGVALADPPVARAVAVPAGTDRGRAALKRIGRDRLAAAVRSTGWSSPTSGDDHLPDPAVLDALAKQWSPE